MPQVTRTNALTPALSPREREKAVTFSAKSGASEIFQRLRTILPLLGERAGVREIITLAIALTFFCADVIAQPKITSLSPDWIQRGTTLDVSFAGEGLGSVTGLVFSGESGLSASLVIETSKPNVSIESSTKAISVAGTTTDRSKTLRARITAASEAALGARE